MSDPVEVRTERAAVELASRDPRVFVALVASNRDPEGIHSNGASPVLVAMYRNRLLAAEAVVWLYRWGYRLGWDGLQAAAQHYATYVRTDHTSSREQQARELAAMCVTDALAWPDPTLPASQV